MLQMTRQNMRWLSIPFLTVEGEIEASGHLSHDPLYYAVLIIIDIPLGRRQS